MTEMTDKEKIIKISNLFKEIIELDKSLEDFNIHFCDENDFNLEEIYQSLVLKSNDYNIYDYMVKFLKEKND